MVGGLNNAGSAGINSPAAVTFDKNGNLYFSDAGNNAVREVFPAGALAFPTTPIGTAAANETVTLANIGNLPVTIASQASFGLSGNTTDFSLVGGSCLAGATLAANGGTCTLQIGFTPTATGTRTLTVSITDDAVYSPQSFSINGVGTTALPVVLNTITPAGAIAGAADTTIIAAGANFTSTSVVNFNTTPLATTFVSATQLTAVVPAALITTAGTANITVTDSFSGSTSQPEIFTILPGTPAVVTFTAPPTMPGEQPTLNFSLTQGYPVEITGTMTLTFAPDTGNPDNPQIQLVSTTTGVTVAPGGRSLTFPLAANSTATPVVMVQVGNVSGTITITLQLTAAGVNVTPIQCRAGYDRCRAGRSYDHRSVIHYGRQYAHRPGDRIFHDSRDSIRDLQLYPRQRSIAEPEDLHRPRHHTLPDLVHHRRFGAVRERLYLHSAVYALRTGYGGGRRWGDAD